MAPPAASDADLILALRAGDVRARDALAARYRPLAQRLAGAWGIPAVEVNTLVDRAFLSTGTAVTAPGPAPVDFGAVLSVALREEVARHVGHRPAGEHLGKQSLDADGLVVRDARLAGAELVASWRMLLWAVHVERVDVERAARVADVRPDEALVVLRRAEEPLASGVTARALHRCDDVHAPFLRLLELRTVGTLDADGAELLDPHIEECESCSATARWLAAFRAEPGATLAAAALGAAARNYLSSATNGPQSGPATRAALVAPAASERSRGPLVAASAVIAALGLLVVAITVPGVSTLSSQTLRVPTPTTADGRPTGAAPEPIWGAVAATAPTTSAIRPTGPAVPGPDAPVTPILTSDDPTGVPQVDTTGPAAGTEAGTEVAPIDVGDRSSAPEASTGPSTPAPSARWTALGSTQSGSSPSGSTHSGSTHPAPSTPAIPQTASAPPAPPTTTPPAMTPPSTTRPAPTPTTPPITMRPVITPPTTTRPVIAPPITTPPVITRPPTVVPSSPATLPPVTTPVTSVSGPAPSPIGVRLTDDWSQLEITPGLVLGRSTTLRNYSKATSAPVVVRVRTPRSLLMGLAADGRPCGRIGLLTDQMSCSIGPLAPGASVRLTFSAVVPRAVGAQTAAVTIAQD